MKLCPKEIRREERRVFGIPAAMPALMQIYSAEENCPSMFAKRDDNQINRGLRVHTKQPTGQQYKKISN